MRNESQNIKTRNNRGVGVDVDVDVNSAFRIPHSALKNRPIHTIVSSPNVDYGAMRLVSGRTGGKFVNLNALSSEQLRYELLNETPQFLGAEHGRGIREVYPSITTPIRGNFSIAGIIDSGNAQLTLLFGFGNRVEKRVRINVGTTVGADPRVRPPVGTNVGTDPNRPPSPSNGNGQKNIDRIWAQKKIAELDLNYETHRAEIEELGARFGIVTRNTALMVLEDVQDYVNYGIAPPASEPELLAEYRRLKKEREEGPEDESEEEREERLRDIERVRARAMLAEAVAAADSLRAWRDTIFDTSPPKPPPPPESPRLADARLSEAIPPPPPPQEKAAVSSASRAVAATERKEIYRGDTLRESLSDPITESNCDILGVEANCGEGFGGIGYGAGYGSGFGGGTGGLSIRRPTIKIKSFKKDAEYLTALTGRVADDYQIYLRLREDYSNLPEFYFDMADHFRKLGATETALRVLTSVSEIEIANAELYRLLNYKLYEYGEHKLQLQICRWLIRRRPFELQNHRDYALALAANGEHQAALDSLYAIFTKIFPWNIRDRSAGIIEVIIMEMNRLIAKHPGLDVSRVDERLIMRIPVDIRVVVNWNRDNTRIGLRVVDPYGEESHSGWDWERGWTRNVTRIGGRSSDETAGYGPEQFILRNAVKGTYKVFVSHFDSREFTFNGPATVLAEVFTKYADRDEQRQVVTLQISRAMTVNWRNQNRVEVAEFEF